MPIDNLTGRSLFLRVSVVQVNLKQIMSAQYGKTLWLWIYFWKLKCFALKVFRLQKADDNAQIQIHDF